MGAAHKVTQPAIDIHVRSMDFEFNEDMPTYWASNNPFITMYITAFSATFPEGEKAFIRSVRYYQHRIKSEKLRAEVSAFIGQEAHHGKEHNALNDTMSKRGYAANAISDHIKTFIAWYENKVSPAHFLANTCAAEHLTAIFAEQLLEKPEFLEMMHESVRPLFLWHAIEESEHKAVAFDVYQEQVNNYWIRIREMIIVTLSMSIMPSKNTFDLLKKDGQLTNFKAAKDAFLFMYGKKGFFRGLLPKYLSYYHPKFHPNQRDTHKMQMDGISLLKTYVGDRAL